MHQHMNKKSVKTKDTQVTTSLVNVSPWWHQRIIGVVNVILALLLVLPGGVEARLGIKLAGLRVLAALICVLLLGMGITARLRAGTGVALPILVMMLSIWVTTAEWGLV